MMRHIKLALLFFVIILLCLGALPQPGEAITLTETIIPFDPPPADWKIYMKSIKVSPDLKHISYVIHNDDGDDVSVMFDSKKGPSYGAIDINTPIFSPDSEHIVYIARKAEKWCAVTDSNEHECYDGISVPFFSPDSSKIAYIAKKGEEKVVVINGKETNTHDGIYSKHRPTFSPTLPSSLT